MLNHGVLCPTHALICIVLIGRFRVGVFLSGLDELSDEFWVDVLKILFAPQVFQHHSVTNGFIKCHKAHCFNGLCLPQLGTKEGEVSENSITTLLSNYDQGGMVHELVKKYRKGDQCIQ